VRIVRFDSGEGVYLGVESDGRIRRPLEGSTESCDDLTTLLSLGPKSLLEFGESANRRFEEYVVDDVALLPPLNHPGKLIGIGLNYRSHQVELGVETPTEPTIFAKFGNTIIGSGQPILLPANAPKRVDYEAELAVVMGQSTRRVEVHEALQRIAGYLVANDISARDWQVKKPGGQWVLGKSFDTFLPLGPAMVTTDEVGSPDNLVVTCTVSDEELQRGNTNDMMFSVAELISYISQVMTLYPGDVILTGTPAGVGMVRTPPRYLRDGDVVETSIDGVGSLVNPVAAEARLLDPATSGAESVMS
jgi:2-keto-4-pentenoate hydratase/2-oxohepta-3-ene-1,7-dioic acid hydratase in catechol pathway